MAPKKADSKTEGAAPKAAASKATPTHGTYQAMITDAIIARKDRYGSSRQALKKYVRANNEINATDSMFDSLFNKALKAGVDKGVFEQPKGPSGGTKLAKKSAAPAAKKPTAKKTAPPKETKEPKEKKAAAPKKAAAKKETKEPKEKKAPAPKKAAPKKETAKKAAAAEEKPAVLSKTKSGRVTKAAAKPTATKKAAPKKAAAPKKEKAAKKEAATA
jgi:histone H1/5